MSRRVRVQVLDIKKAFSNERLLKKWGGLLWYSKGGCRQVQMSNITQLSVRNEWRNKELLHQKYVVERRSLNELAVEFGVARQTISRQMKEFEIETRISGATQNRKRGLAYGEKCRERELRIHKRELENIQKMRELRDKGFSYWKIADVFNSMGVPTKTRKGRWHAKTIQQILKI